MSSSSSSSSASRTKRSRAAGSAESLCKCPKLAASTGPPLLSEFQLQLQRTITTSMLMGELYVVGRSTDYNSNYISTHFVDVAVGALELDAARPQSFLDVNQCGLGPLRQSLGLTFILLGLFGPSENHYEAQRYAVIKAHLRVLMAGYDPHLLDANGNNLLGVLSATSMLLNDEEYQSENGWLQVLVTRGMDVNRPFKLECHDATKPVQLSMLHKLNQLPLLVWASQRTPSLATLLFLLKNGADVTARSLATQVTFLHMLVDPVHLTLLGGLFAGLGDNLLLLDFCAKNANGSTPLSIALEYSQATWSLASTTDQRSQLYHLVTNVYKEQQKLRKSVETSLTSVVCNDVASVIMQYADASTAARAYERTHKPAQEVDFTTRGDDASNAIQFDA